MLVSCPQCGTKVEWNDNKYRPFCSERCQMIDFGAWADGDYALPDRSTALSEEEMREVEKALEQSAQNE